MRVFSFPFGKKKVPSPLELRQAQLLEDLTETRRQLAAARCLFQQTSDQDLVAASVYEINLAGPLLLSAPPGQTP